MSMLIDLTPDEEAAVRANAAKQGVDVSAFVREKLFPVSESDTPAEDLRFVRADSLAAVRAAQQNLLDKGIGYVVARETDGAVVRRFADGTETVLAPAGAG